MKLVYERASLNINSNLKRIFTEIENKIRIKLSNANNVNLTQNERLYNLELYNSYCEFVIPINDIINKVKNLKFNDLIEFRNFMYNQNYKDNFINYVYNYINDDYNEQINDINTELRD